MVKLQCWRKSNQDESGVGDVGCGHVWGGGVREDLKGWSARRDIKQRREVKSEME